MAEGREDPFQLLSEEIRQEIISYLPLHEQLQLQRLSRSWRDSVDGCLDRRRSLSFRDVYHGFHPGDDGVEWTDFKEVVRRLLARMPVLRSISFSPTPLDMDLLSEYCHQLRNVDLSEMTSDEASILKLCVSCPKLQDVTMPRDCSDAEVAIVLRHLPGLRSLTIESEQVTGECLALLPASLESLNVDGCLSMISAHVRQIERCTALKKLTSPFQNVHASDIQVATSACLQLESLSLRLGNQALEECLPPTGIPSLRKLYVEGDGTVTDETLRLLCHIQPALTDLTIYHCRGVNEAGMLHLCQFREMRTLTVLHSATTDAVMNSLRGSQQLESLGFSVGHGMTTQSVVQLATSCPRLRTMSLNFFEPEGDFNEWELEELEREGQIPPGCWWLKDLVERIERENELMHIVLEVGEELQSWILHECNIGYGDCGVQVHP